MKNSIKTALKIALPIAAFAGIAYSSVSHAGNFGTRDTLHVTLAQRKLALEAPQGMCFLDPSTSAQQSAIYSIISGFSERRGDQVMIAAFTSCDDLGNLQAWQEGVPTAGAITWLNPSVGETTSMTRQDYLDMREASFPEYARTTSFVGIPDKQVHRTKDSVSLASVMNQPHEHPPRKSTNVIATTTLRNIPVEIVLHYAGDDVPSISEAYPLMDKLVEQNVILNEGQAAPTKTASGK